MTGDKDKLYPFRKMTPFARWPLHGHLAYYKNVSGDATNMATQEAPSSHGHSKNTYAWINSFERNAEWLVHIGWLRNHPTSKWVGNSGTPANHEPHPQHRASKPQWNPQCLASLSRIWTSYQHPNFFLLIYLNWRLSTLQYCGGFLYALTWISPGGTRGPILNHPSPQGCPSAPALSALFHASNLDCSCLSHMVISMLQCYSLKSSHPRLLPRSPKVCSLHLCLFCFLAYRVVVTIFLNSIYMCYYNVLGFFFLAFFTLYNRLQFHPPH